MARPSLDSPSMAELVFQAKSRRKSNAPSSFSSASLDADTVGSSTAAGATARDTPETTNAASSSEIEAIKRRYAIQNQALAKNNSVMHSKLSNMERRLGDLISENMSIRRQKSLEGVELKESLDSKLRSIEDRLYTKFEEIFQMFKDIRTEEGLSQNAKLNVFTKDIIDREVSSLRCLRSPILSPSKGGEVEEVEKSEEPRNVTKSNSKISQEDEVHSGTENRTESQGSISDQVPSNKPKASKRRSTISKLNSSGQESTIVDKTGRSSEVAPPSEKTSSVLSQGKGSEKETQGEEQVGANKNISQEQIAVSPRRPRRNRKEVSYKPVSLHKKLRRETDWLVTAVGNEPISTSFRKQNTPEIYVHEDEAEHQEEAQPVTHTQVKDEQVKEKPASRMKRKSIVQDNSKTANKRKPLGELSTNSGIRSDLVSDKVSQEDLSIFDFEDEDDQNSENKPFSQKQKKTYGRRLLTSSIRRHSML